MKRFFLILLASALLMGCGSTKHLPEVQVVSHTIHDTLYTTQIAYDSIYVNQSHNQEYHRDQRIPQPSTINLQPLVDTIYLEKVKQEFRYKYLHDTIRVVKVDSIPVIKTVTEVQQVKYVPSIYKWSLGIVITLLITLILYIVWKIKF